jgi:hypothetical protein
VFLNGNISLEAKGVWIALALHADVETGECWPSIGTIQAALRMGRHKVRRAICELEDLGVVKKKTSRTGNLKSATRFEVSPLTSIRPVSRSSVDRNSACRGSPTNKTQQKQDPTGTKNQYLGAAPLREEEVASFLEEIGHDANLAGEACRLVKFMTPNWQERVRGLAEKVASDRSAIFAPLLRHGNVEEEEPF